MTEHQSNEEEKSRSINNMNEKMENAIAFEVFKKSLSTYKYLIYGFLAIVIPFLSFIGYRVEKVSNECDKIDGFKNDLYQYREDIKKYAEAVDEITMKVKKYLKEMQQIQDKTNKDKEEINNALEDSKTVGKNLKEQYEKMQNTQLLRIKEKVHTKVPIHNISIYADSFGLPWGVKIKGVTVQNEEGTILYRQKKDEIIIEKQTILVKDEDLNYLYKITFELIEIAMIEHDYAMVTVVRKNISGKSKPE